MSKLSVEQFAKMIGVTRQRVNKFITDGYLVREDRKIDTDHPTNAAWLLHRKEQAAYGSAAPLPGTPPPPPAVPIDDEHFDTLQGVDAEDVLAAVAGIDLRRISKVDIDKIKNLESLLKIRVEREHKRGELVDRSLVQTAFGKLYQIDSSELRVMAPRLAPEIAALLSVDDPEKILEVELMIDQQVIKTLAHIKRTMDKFLRDIGGTEVTV